MRKTPKTLALTFISTAILLTMTAGMSDATPLPRSNNLESLGSANGNDELSGDLTAEVNAVTRNEAGNLLSVTWSIANSGSDNVTLSWFNQYSYVYSGPNFAGVTAFSSDTGTRYHPIMDGENYCLCSGEYSAQLMEIARPGETVTYWSLYSVPSNIDSITLELPNFEPIEDVPIS